VFVAADPVFVAGHGHGDSLAFFGAG
jgi:hypothetical protein